MHETHIFKNMMKYLEGEEVSSGRKIKKIYVSLSEFGGISREHFFEHCNEAFRGTKWEKLEIEAKSVPYGAEFEITKIEFV